MGKGGGALSMWIKEFTALVFTQTIQAFIYAIIISIILFGMVSGTDSISADDNNASLGLMATFALLSVFKVEEMTKKIFGIGDTKASHKNAMRSIAKTAIAAKLGSRVLNNVGKVLGGAKSINKAGQDRRKAKARLQEDMKDNGFAMKDGKAVYVGKGKGGSSAGASTSTMSAAQKQYYDAAKAAKAGGDMDGYHANMELAAAVRKGEQAIMSASNAGSSGDVISDSAKRRMKNALRSYEDQLSEINKARDEGIKDIFSGLTESVGAGVGAITGGILGGADGDIDELLQGIMAGAGVGDTLGKNAVDGLDRAVQFAKRNANRQRGVSSSNLKKTISEYKSAIEDLNVKYGTNDVSDI